MERSGGNGGSNAIDAANESDQMDIDGREQGGHDTAVYGIRNGRLDRLLMRCINPYDFL